MTTLKFRGKLQGHGNWVTAIIAPDTIHDINSTTPRQSLLSVSRDRSLIQWDLSGRSDDPLEYGRAHRALRGHSHYIQDITVSRDGQFALTASWDKTIRLWDLNAGVSPRIFKGHTNDVMSVSFSPDNRQIVTGGRDRSIRLWNTVGECKCVINEGTHNYPHSDWVSAVKFSPNPLNPIVVSASWDKTIKVWSIGSTFNLLNTLIGHTGYINDIAISPDGTLCASAGKDGTVMLWDLNEGKHLFSLEAGDIVNKLAFSPNKFWLVAATDSDIKVLDLEHKQLHVTLDQNEHVNSSPGCTSITWSHDGSTLFSGHKDGLIAVWGLGSI